MKLPINPLLYLISLGSVAAMVFAALQLTENKDAYETQAAAVRVDIKKLRESARKADTSSGDWDYQKKWFWEQFGTANFTGKVKKVEEATEENVDEVKKPEASRVDLNEVLNVIAITYGTGIHNCVVDYTASVEVPEEFQVSPNAGVLSSIPAGRRKRSQPAPMPTGGVGSSPPHHLKVGDALWPPFAHVYVKSISKDAGHVEFEFRTKKNDEGEYETQDVHKNELGLPEEIAKNLREGRKKLKAGEGSKKAPAGGSTDVSSADGGYVWRDQPTTFVDRRGNVNISRKDSQWLSSNASQVFNEDVHLRDYSAGTGKYKVRGIQLRKISPRMRKFGAQEGDVVVSVNNQPVKGQAHAKRVGRRLYDRGVRSFKVEVIRRGERQILTFHMNKK